MFVNTVEDVPRPESNSKMKITYPCLCQAISTVGKLARLAGITPIVGESHPQNKTCIFYISRNWRNYSYCLQTIYLIYVTVAYTIRLHCGADHINVMQWYFITFGYFITDVNSICSITLGTVFAKRACALYQKLSTLNSSAREMLYLRSFMHKFILIACLLYGVTFPTYCYIAFLKIGLLESHNYCNILDFPSAIIARGFTLIFPTIELFSITTLCLVIRNKYKNLKTRTYLTCKIYTGNNSSPKTQRPSPILNNTQETNSEEIKSLTFHQLKQLTIDQREISYCLKEINVCIGFQLLVACVSCLYTSIFYLYRYSTSRGRAASYEKLHYAVGLIYRTGKLIVYMILGQEISTYSQEPLRVLQRANLMELPFKIQQQLQTLILQWSNQKGMLSAVGVVNMGLWLLPPIVGNVITYLLVALQFENHNVLPNNVTAILEYIF